MKEKEERLTWALHVCALRKVKVIGPKGSDGWDLEFSLVTILIPILYPCLAQNVRKELCLERMTT
jgi:hypothetical protein